MLDMRNGSGYTNRQNRRSGPGAQRKHTESRMGGVIAGLAHGSAGSSLVIASPSTRVKRLTIAMSQSRWTPGERRCFLDRLRETANVSAAARAAGKSRSSAYQLRQQDADFRAAWDEALEEALDMLEAELWRRALEGVARPVFYGGKCCGVIRSYSDQLGMFLLKAHRPERYGALTRSRREADGEKDGEAGEDPRAHLLALLGHIRARIGPDDEEPDEPEGSDAA